MVDLFITAQNIFEPIIFCKTSFIGKKGMVNPIFLIQCRCFPISWCADAHTGLRGTFCMVGRKPMKINFLTSCSYENMLFTASLQSQSHALWVLLTLFPSLKMLTKETNEEGGSPTRFFLEDECLACKCSPAPLPFLLEMFYCKFGHR